MAAYSRRIKVEEKENRRKAFGFGLLTLAFIAFMFYFGLPLLARVSNFTYDLRRSGEPVEGNDKTPPPPPSLDDIPSFTNKDNIEISGNTEAGSKVVIYVNSHKEEVIADASGSFSRTVPVNDGGNSIYAYAEDSSGNKSQETPEYSVTFDNDPPKLTVSSPIDGSEFTGQKEKQLTIKGSSEKDAQIQVNDRFVIVNSDGSFSYVIGLNEGDNILTVKVTDQAGNSTEKSLTVKFTP